MGRVLLLSVYKTRIQCLGVFGFLTFSIAVVALVLGLLYPMSNMSIERSVIDEFAYTMTQKNIERNQMLFAENATIDFHRLMRFLVPPTQLSIEDWAEQLQTFMPTFRTNHMTYSNFNVTRLNSTFTHVFALGYYTWTYDSIDSTARLTTVVSSYTVEFWLQNQKIFRAQVLANATNTVITSELFGSGVAPPGPLLSKRNSNAASTWANLLLQIDALVNAGQSDQARIICKTLHYETLANQFDPQRSNSSLACNNFVDPVSDDLGIVSVNHIPPFMRDFTIIGGFGITVTGGMNSLTIDNFMQMQVPEEFEVFIMDGSTYFVKVNQSANTVWAGPVSGANDQPTFRFLVESDIPLLNAQTALYGTLPVTLGGTGNNASFSGQQIILSSVDGQSLVEGQLVGGYGINVTVSGSSIVVEISDNGVVQVQLIAPSDLFQVTSSPVVSNGSHVFEPVNQQSNTVWAGPVSGSADRPSFRMLAPSDIPILNASTQLNGILLVENGGTGTGGPFMGQKIIISTPISLEEGELVAGDGISLGINGLVLEIENTGIVWVPEDLFVLTNNKSFVPKDQLLSHVWIGNAFGPPTFRLLEKADLPLLNATVIEGGTGRTELFQSYRVLLSNGAGDTIVESGILNDGDLLIGQSGGIPVVGQITAAPGGGIIVTPSAGMIQLALGEVLSTTELTVSGSTFLGPNTTCINPLQASCYDISNQQCDGGALHQNCIPMDLTVQTLTVLNSTILGTVLNQEFLNVTNLMVDSFTCSSSSTIDQDCFDISGKMCSMGNALSESCIPTSLVMLNMDVTSNLTVNNVICNSGALVDSCIPLRVGSISGILPSSGSLDFNIQSGSGITITPITNGLLIDNSGQLTVPNDLFSSMGLSFTTNAQLPNSFWAGPASGGPAVPAFRTLQIADLPPLQPHQIYFGNFGPTNLTGMGSLLINDSNPGELILNGIGITNLLAPMSIFSVNLSTVNQASIDLIAQNGNFVFAGPDGSTGLPTFRALEFSDLPMIPLIGGTGISIGANLTIENTGVTSVGLQVPNGIFSVTQSPVTTTGSLAFDVIEQGKNLFWAGPIDGPDADPVFRAMNLLDLPVLPAGEIFISNGTHIVGEQLQAGPGIQITDLMIEASLVSVGLSVPLGEFTVSNSPLVFNGTLVIGKANQAANTFWAGPVNGPADEPIFRSMDLADLQSLNLQNGQLLIGNTGGAPSAANLIAGSNVVITNSPGGITISASVNTSMIGTVMSVGLSAPPSIFSVSGSPVTSSGTLGLNLLSQAAKSLWMGPVSGPAALPTFRALEYSDLPLGIPINLSAGAGISISGSFVVSNTMSVGLSIGGPLFSVSNSPVTAAGGTLTATLNPQSANTFFAAPDGSAGLPSFRSLGLSDLPSLNNGQLYIGQGGVVVASGLAAGLGITINTGPGTITISSTGEANTGQNVGTLGVGVFKQKVGTSLEFKKLHSPDGSVSIVDDVANSKINLQVAASAFGGNFQFIRNTAASSTTSTAWSVRQTLTTPSLPAGTYRVEFTTIHNSGNPNTTPGVRLVLNGNANYFFGGQIFAMEQKDSNRLQRESYHGTDYFVGSGINTIQLEFSRVSGNQPVQILFSSISIQRVS